MPIYEFTKVIHIVERAPIRIEADSPQEAHSFLRKMIDDHDNGEDNDWGSAQGFQNVTEEYVDDKFIGPLFSIHDVNDYLGD